MSLHRILTPYSSVANSLSTVLLAQAPVQSLVILSVLLRLLLFLVFPAFLFLDACKTVGWHHSGPAALAGIAGQPWWLSPRAPLEAHGFDS